MSASGGSERMVDILIPSSLSLVRHSFKSFATIKTFTASSGVEFELDISASDELSSSDETPEKGSSSSTLILFN